MQHPYLYVSRNDIHSFRERIKTDEALRARYKAAVSGVENCLKEEFITEEYANGRESLHANFGALNGQTNRMASVLGVKYLVEGDDRCAEKLKALLEHFTRFERWYAHSYTVRKPIPWHSDLCSTAMTLACGLVYDIIHDYLSPEEQERYAQRIFELGVLPALSDWTLPETRIHAVDSMGHNWWAVCTAEAATSLLALQDHLPAARVKQILNDVNESLAAYFTYPGNKLFNKLRNYDEQSLFYESIGYFEYGTSTPLRYLWCSERYFGENRTIREALPKNLGDTLMEFSYPYTKDGKTKYAFMNFGDSGVWDERLSLMKYLSRNGLATSATRAAYANAINDIWDDIGGYTTEAPGASVDNLPLTQFFSSGYMVTRDSWKPDATMLAIKSGFCWNHSHNDSGTFNIYHKGRPLIIDNGTCDYDHKLYHAYYCQDWAHNVLRIGGKGRRDEELYRGTKFPGALIDRYEDDGCLFVQADCTGPMAHLCSRMYRNFFWIDNRILVIFDDVFTHTEDTVDFSLHYAGQLTKGNDVYQIDDGDSHARLISHLPAGMVPADRIGHADHKPDEDETYLELSTTEAARTHLLIHTLELDPEDHATKMRPIKCQDSEGIAIEEGNIVREFWFNHMADGHVMHDNSNTVIAGFDTDAYMLVITRDKLAGTEKVLAVCCSYLRRGGEVYLSSFTKTTRKVITSL